MSDNETKAIAEIPLQNASATDPGPGPFYNASGIMVDLATGESWFQGKKTGWVFQPFWVTDGKGNSWPGDPTSYPTIGSAETALKWLQTFRPEAKELYPLAQDFQPFYTPPLAWMVKTGGKLDLSCAAIINAVIRHDESFAKRQIGSWWDRYSQS